MTEADVFAMVEGVKVRSTGADHYRVVWLTPGQPTIWPMRLRRRYTVHRA